jgi:uncharacterized protein YbaP (TraB family)
MWFIKIGLTLIAFLNVPLSEVILSETTSTMNMGGASGEFDRYGTYSNTHFSTPLRPEFKEFDALTLIKPDSSEFDSPKPRELSVKQALQGPPLLTHFNPHFKVPLYEVNKSGMAKSIYLLGSSHNVPLESYPEVVSRTASLADVLGVEIMGEESLLSPKMVEFGLYNDSGFNWISKLSDENQEKLKMLSASMDNYHPALVLFLFSNMGVNVYRQRSGINAQLQSAFALQGKPRFAVETRQERVTMGTGIDPRILIPLARKFSFSGESLNGNFMKYCKEIILEHPLEDIESFAHMDQEHLGDLHPVYHTARNENWLPRILDAITNFQGQVILMDVGFLHLPGNKGLLRLLEQENFTLTRVE